MIASQLHMPFLHVEKTWKGTGRLRCKRKHVFYLPHFSPAVRNLGLLFLFFFRSLRTTEFLISCFPVPTYEAQVWAQTWQGMPHAEPASDFSWTRFCMLFCEMCWSHSSENRAASTPGISVTPILWKAAKHILGDPNVSQLRQWKYSLNFS